VSAFRNLANTNNYYYIIEDYRDVVASLRDVVDELETQFKIWKNNLWIDVQWKQIIF